MNALTHEDNGNSIIAEVHRVRESIANRFNNDLKAICDEIFNRERLVNEIAWKRTTAHGDAAQGARRYDVVHDTLLFYTRSDTYTWNHQYQKYDDDYLDTFFDQVDQDGRRWKRTDLTGAGVRKLVEDLWLVAQWGGSARVEVSTRC